MCDNCTINVPTKTTSVVILNCSNVRVCLSAKILIKVDVIRSSGIKLAFVPWKSDGFESLEEEKEYRLEEWKYTAPIFHVEHSNQVAIFFSSPPLCLPTLEDGTVSNNEEKEISFQVVSAHTSQLYLAYSPYATRSDTKSIENISQNEACSLADRMDKWISDSTADSNEHLKSFSCSQMQKSNGPEETDLDQYISESLGTNLESPAFFQASATDQVFRANQLPVPTENESEHDERAPVQSRFILRVKLEAGSLVPVASIDSSILQRKGIMGYIDNA
jgi:hypothetical protein